MVDVAQVDETVEDEVDYSVSIPEALPGNYMVDVAQVVRALVCGTRGRGFESHLLPQHDYPIEYIGV